MTTTEFRPESADRHGATHRHGCEQPGWSAEPSRVRGFAILRCHGCGAVRLARISAATDDVTDDEFDEALDRAQSEQNVSRANVVRKVRETKSGTEAQYG